MLSKSSSTHDAFFTANINEITGRIDKQYNNFYSFFTLKEANKELVAENARLRDSLRQNYLSPDNSKKIVTDTTIKDSTGRYRKFTYLPALVVGNTVTSQTNYLTLERGALQGVRKGMSVIGPQGIVGTVIDVNNNFSRVMSLLHRNSKVSAMLLKDNIAGSVDWDGVDPSYVTLKNIPKSAKIKIGDTVVTSTYSANYPSHIPIGTIAGISAESSSNFYTLKLKTATNFYSIQYVYVLDNVRFAEQIKIESAIQKNNE